MAVAYDSKYIQVAVVAQHVNDMHHPFFMVLLLNTATETPTIIPVTVAPRMWL